MRLYVQKLPLSFSSFWFQSFTVSSLAFATSLLVLFFTSIYMFFDSSVLFTCQFSNTDVLFDCIRDSSRHHLHGFMILSFPRSFHISLLLFYFVMYFHAYSVFFSPTSFHTFIFCASFQHSHKLIPTPFSPLFVSTIEQFIAISILLCTHSCPLSFL